jgi:aryl-alcohol dehydrogenase-like predicted oxidoreductase
MTFGAPGWGADETASREMLDAFTDAGGTFVDTADVYSGGASESLLGRFLHGRRDRYVVATKFGFSTDPDDPNASGGGRRNLVRSLEASLRRLRTEYVDLYWVHVWDPLTPLEETLRALDDAVRAGKVLDVGFSDFPAWLVARADALAQAWGLTRPAAIQVEYNLAARDADRELLPMAETLGLGVMDWSPLAGGVLTGKYLSGGAADTGSVPRAEGITHFAKYGGDRAARVARTVVDVARSLGCTPSQLAIAWLRERSPLHVPIVGARTVAQLRDNLGASDVRIPADVLARLDAVSRIDLGFPMDFYPWAGDGGATLPRLDPRVRPRARRILGLPT